MRMTQEEYDALQRRRKDPLQEVILSHGFTGGKVPKKKAAAGKWQGGNLRLILPFKLPTWNQLLAMDHWQRRRVREWIKGQVSTCILSGEDLQTPMGSARRLLLTPLCLQEYSEMITPNASKKLRSRKKKAP